MLRWMDNPAEYEAPRTGYRIYRGVLPGQTNLVLVDSIPNNSVKDTSAVPGIRYYYATTALYANGMESEKSNEVTGMLMVGGGCNK